MDADDRPTSQSVLNSQLITYQPYPDEAPMISAVLKIAVVTAWFSLKYENIYCTWINPSKN